MSSCTHTIIEKDARCPDTFTTLHLMPLRQDSHWSWNKMVASTPTSSFCLCSLHTVLGLRHLCCRTCLFMRYLDLSSSGLHSKCFYLFKHLSCSYVWKVFNNGCITETSLEGYFIPGPSPQLFLLTEIYNSLSRYPHGLVLILFWVFLRCLLISTSQTCLHKFTNFLPVQSLKHH